jgi:AraC family transcriptional regulator
MAAKTTAEAPRPAGLAGWQRKVAITLMSEHLAVGIRHATLADACCLSPSAFLRGFVRETGSTPHRWLMARRVERALDLMKDPALVLCDIALRVGFADQSHFTRVFTKQMGASPGAWRRERRRPAASDISRPPASAITGE